MTISISSRVRNAMVGLSIALSFLFSALIFLLVYVIEDQIFVNQIKAEKLKYEQAEDVAWQPQNGNIKLVSSSSALPEQIPNARRLEITQQQGVHEYFDNQNALFIAHFRKRGDNEPYFLVYNVKGLLAVRSAKLELLGLIALLTILICVAAIYLAHRLAKQTLAPVRKLTNELRTSDIDDGAIALANNFSGDDVGILAQELASALERASDSAQREHEFNRGVSHELRTPIQVAQSATELLELQLTTDDESLTKPLKRLKHSVHEMNQIVDAFLWLASNRQSGPTDTCAAARIQVAVQQYQSRNPLIQWRLDYRLASDTQYKLPESVMLVILRNLIENAIRHGDGHTIAIELGERSIAVENIIRTPVPNKGTDNQPPSFGLGYTIAQRLCEHFDCELNVSNKVGGSYTARLHVSNE